MSSAEKALQITGVPAGPYPVGVVTVQIDDVTGARRGLQTEIWFPAADAARTAPVTKFSEYLGLDGATDPAEALRIANSPAAFGGYRDGLTIAELDSERSTWRTNAVRGAAIRSPEEGEGKNRKWPLVVFSHGAGAYRASYSFWTEFLASHGYIVAAPDHPGSARYTIIDGRVITPAYNHFAPQKDAGFDRTTLESDRVRDVVQVVDGIAARVNADVLAGHADTDNVALTGMSFGGHTVAAALELRDPRVRAAVTLCSAASKMGTRDYHRAEKGHGTPVLCAIGTEDTVLGAEANDANRSYVARHGAGGDAYLLEVRRGGHVSFTSCEMYDPEYGNGIAADGECNRLTGSGTYRPLAIAEQHAIVNSYGLAFLDKYLKSAEGDYLKANHFSPDEVIFRKG